MKNKLLPEAGLLLTTLIWGGTFALVKNSLYDSSPMTFLFARFAIASIVCLAILNKKIFEIKKDQYYAGLFLGFLLFLGFALQTIGLNITSATKSGFITGSLVVFTPIVQAIILRKIPSIGVFISVVLVFIGLFLMSSPADDWRALFYEFGGGFNFGDFLTLLCAIAWAFYIVYLNIYGSKYHYLSLSFIQIFVTAILSLLTALAFDFYKIENIKFNLSNSLIGGLLYTSLLATVATTILHTRFQKEVMPVKAGIIFSLEPIFAAIISFIFLGEMIGALGYIGGFFIFIGLLLTEIYDFVIKKNGVASEKKS